MELYVEHRDIILNMYGLYCDEKSCVMFEVSRNVIVELSIMILVYKNVCYHSRMSG